MGPNWTPGKDGGQNPTTLLKEMKQENKREQRQYRQTMEQNIEQQQLDYEKKTIEKLKDQRKGILGDETELKQERKESGSD